MTKNFKVLFKRCYQWLCIYRKNHNFQNYLWHIIQGQQTFVAHGFLFDNGVPSPGILQCTSCIFGPTHDLDVTRGMIHPQVEFIQGYLFVINENLHYMMDEVNIVCSTQTKDSSCNDNMPQYHVMVINRWTSLMFI